MLMSKIKNIMIKIEFIMEAFLKEMNFETNQIP